MSMNMLVLAGGFGTRLRAVVSKVPKSLAPVNGIPFLELQLKHWIAQGQDSFIFLLHYEAGQIIDFLIKNKKGFLYGISIEWIVECEPLGTGGAILNAIKEFDLKNDFLVVNSDTWLSSGLKVLRSASSPTIGIVKVQDSSRYGLVQFDDKLKVTGFSESFMNTTSTEESWINAGIYKLSARFFKLERMKQFSLESDMLVNGFGDTVLKALKLDVDFIDIGVPRDYKKFCDLRK